MNALHRGLLLMMVAFLPARLARAAPLDSAPMEPPPVDVTTNAESTPILAPRPWLYLDDPSTPAAGRVTAFSRATYTGTNGSPTRPFGTDIAHPGGVLEAGGEVGITSWLSIAASGYTSTLAPTDNASAGGLVGIRVAPFARAWTSTQLVVSGGALRELSGGTGAWSRVAIAHEWSRARVAAMVHGEHVFARGRDGVDMMVSAGASYQVAGPVRLGVEYVAEDIEEAVDAEVEGGMRHFVGPTASVEILDRRLTLVTGPAFGLSRGSPPVLGRLGVGYAF